MNENKKRILTGCLCAVLCEIIFGFSFLFTKQITQSVSPVSLLGWRFLFAFVLINICVFSGILHVDFSKLRGRAVLPVAAASFFHPVLYFTGETFGIALTTASESGVVIASVPIVTITVAAVFLHETPTPARIAGILVTLTGVLICVVSKGIEATFSPVGYAMLFMALLAYSFFCVFVRKAKNFSSTEITYMMLLFGTVFFAGASFAENAAAGTLKDFVMLPLTSRSFLIALIYLGAGCSVFAFILNNAALERIGPNGTVSFVGLTTLVTIVAGVILLHESFTWIQVAGTALILGGVYLANASDIIKAGKPDGSR